MTLYQRVNRNADIVAMRKEKEEEYRKKKIREKEIDRQESKDMIILAIGLFILIAIGGFVEGNL